MTLTLTFTDGTSKSIPITKAFELQLSPERKQSIEFRETGKGWVMSYSKGTLEGKELRSLEFNQGPPKRYFTCSCGWSGFRVWPLDDENWCNECQGVLTPAEPPQS